jgi:hypothetical protein
MKEEFDTITPCLCTERGEGTGICGHAVLRQIVSMVKALSPDGRRRTARLLGCFTLMTEEGQYNAVEQVGLLMEVPRFRKPEPRPVPTVRLPIKEDK